MKLITIYALTVFLAVVLLCSCKRTYTCSCSSGWGAGLLSLEIRSTSKAHAEKECTSHNNDFKHCDLNGQKSN